MLAQARAACVAQGLPCDEMTEDMLLEGLNGNGISFSWFDESAVTYGSPVDYTMFAIAFVASGGKSTAAKEVGAAVKFTGDSAALIALAKEARIRGVSVSEAKTLLDWADEYGVKPALDHINTTHWIWGGHIRIGPINHISVR